LLPSREGEQEDWRIGIDKDIWDFLPEVPGAKRGEGAVIVSGRELEALLSSEGIKFQSKHQLVGRKVRVTYNEEKRALVGLSSMERN
jgi:hypothetical protein